MDFVDHHAYKSYKKIYYDMREASDRLCKENGLSVIPPSQGKGMSYINNPIAADRLRYDVLYHTDLSREHGLSNGIDLDRLNWGNYDLVVIDESHNFRNGGEVSGEDAYESGTILRGNKLSVCASDGMGLWYAYH